MRWCSDQPPAVGPRLESACPSRLPLRSATFLPLLAAHAQDRSRKCLQPCLADRLAARLARSIGAGINLVKRPLGLRQKLAGVVGQRELVLSLVRLRAHVRLIIARVYDSVTQPVRDIRLGPVDLGSQLRGFSS